VEKETICRKQFDYKFAQPVFSFAGLSPLRKILGVADRRGLI